MPWELSSTRYFTYSGLSCQWSCQTSWHLTGLILRKNIWKVITKFQNCWYHSCAIIYCPSLSWLQWWVKWCTYILKDLLGARCCLDEGGVVVEGKVLGLLLHCRLLLSQPLLLLGWTNTRTHKHKETSSTFPPWRKRINGCRLFQNFKRVKITHKNSQSCPENIFF